ncbi:MAG: Na(+)-translocating NADH-quinone reductase subunit C [Planctomycetaceae bacterium]|nr:MAG: Na(+)-translocating NADH-quinone reductase subunit C [Planctomycetaceae bacterium]
MAVDSVAHTFRVALMVCAVCAVLVSGAAVGLRQQQLANKDREKKANILQAAGLSDLAAREGVESLFRQRVEVRLIDLQQGELVSEPRAESYDPRRALRDPTQSEPVPADQDVARVRRREKWAPVYLIKDSQGNVELLVLPIRGYGLWSTLWGFVALDAPSIVRGPEHVTIRGITYYEHGETPGLGGEVDNPAWKSKWVGKRVYDENWQVRLHVIKGEVRPDDHEAPYKVDGLSGATLTSNGVSNMLAFWFGPEGYLPFLQKLHQQPHLLPTRGASRG